MCGKSLLEVNSPRVIPISLSPSSDSSVSLDYGIMEVVNPKPRLFAGLGLWLAWYGLWWLVPVDIPRSGLAELVRVVVFCVPVMLYGG